MQSSVFNPEQDRAIMPVVQQIRPQDRFQNLIRRLNKLETGKRYMITLTVGGSECDHTVLELGKVE